VTTGKPPSQQIPFDLGHRAAFAREDFFVSVSNSEAVAWVDKWPVWPAPALVIHGPAGSGKTHLLHVWRAHSGSAQAIDDVDLKIGHVAEEEKIFHLYNEMKESGGHLLLTASSAPQSWRFVIPDLKSRLLAAPAVALGSPDDTLMAVVLTKLFSDRQIFVPQDVVQFILPRVERSFAALGAVVQKIDRRALAEKRAVTIPFIRDLFQDQKGLI
jgi:chromosomal replication initiation ATPase DnaA